MHKAMDNQRPISEANRMRMIKMITMLGVRMKLTTTFVRQYVLGPA